MTVIDAILITAGGNWWIFLLQACLIVGIIWVLLHRTYFQHERNELTDDDIRSRIQESLAGWGPEDLVPSNVIKERILNPRVVCGKARKHIKVDGHMCLNLSTLNFLDLIGNEEIEDYAVGAIEKYGVGSCGPRGFYGTVEAHLELEQRLAKFMGTEDAIVYSYGFSCIASAIPAYAKRQDIIFADERVNFAIQKGLYASRSTIRYFRHNDPENLEILLMEQAREDIVNPDKAAKTRRFVILEGIYLNTGEVCELPFFIALKHRYKFRLFIDESISFGTVSYGRGITRHYNIPIEEVDMVMGTLEYAIGSIGGFCCGSKFIIEHQRLSGLGYCFSASQPPLHAVAALQAIEIMEKSPAIFHELDRACKSLNEGLRNLRGIEIRGWESSPIKHLYLRSSRFGNASQEETLQKISDLCIRYGLAVTCPSYIEEEENYFPDPSLRISVNRRLKPSDIEEAVSILQIVLDEIEYSLQTEDDDLQAEGDDHEAREQRRREARQRARQEREQIRRVQQLIEGEVRQRPHETNRARQRRTEHEGGGATSQSSQTPEEIRQAREDRLLEEYEYLLDMFYQPEVRRTHRQQIGGGHPQAPEHNNQPGEQAHIEELDNDE